MFKNITEDQRTFLIFVLFVFIFISSIWLADKLEVYLMARAGMCYQAQQVQNHEPINSYTRCK